MNWNLQWKKSICFDVWPDKNFFLHWRPTNSKNVQNYYTYQSKIVFQKLITTLKLRHNILASLPNCVIIIAKPLFWFRNWCFTELLWILNICCLRDFYDDDIESGQGCRFTAAAPQWKFFLAQLNWIEMVLDSASPFTMEQYSHTCIEWSCTRKRENISALAPQWAPFDVQIAQVKVCIICKTIRQITAGLRLFIFGAIWKCSHQLQWNWVQFSWDTIIRPIYLYIKLK